MIISFNWDNRKYLAHLEKGIDLSITYKEGSDQVNCFFAPFYKSEPVTMGSFIGSVEKGGPVNFYNTQINIHGSGTHTESVGHISKERGSVQQLRIKQYMIAQLCTVYPTLLENGDRAITQSTLEIMLEDLQAECLILRCMPNPKEKRTNKYSGTNPCYIVPSAMELIVHKKIQHLLVDLPSVDREEDGGKLESHKIFWQNERAANCSITELIYVPDEVKDGLYLLNLQLGPMEGDAAPSRPIIYAIKENDFEV
jgi:arylformamidase